MHFEFSWDNFTKLSELIYKKTGIYLSKEQHYNKLQQLFSKTADEKIKDFKDYFTALRFGDEDGSLFEELINTITINETYFFRENYQLEILVCELLPKLAATKDSLRILSAPCSSGEEPYSIAMYLLEDARVVNSKNIEIIGIDIDQTCIQRAKKAVYTPRSVRMIPQSLNNKYFTQINDEFHLKDEIKNAIEFKKANVFSKDDMRKLGKFDVIFSRNMLIYFDDASQKEVVTTFYEMLNKGGYLALGHAEYLSSMSSILTPLRMPLPNLTAFSLKEARALVTTSIKDVLVYQKD